MPFLFLVSWFQLGVLAFHQDGNWYVAAFIDIAIDVAL